MRIAVCLKQVPEDARFDRAANTVVREERSQALNPSDVYALETALEIKDRLGAEVVALTMGKPFAARVLTAAATLGADALYLVSDPAFAGSDTFATASVLREAVRHIGGADLILCGRRAVDGETGQVGPELAVLLGIPCLTNVAALESVTRTHIVCSRLLEDRWETYRTPFPCLLTVCDGVDNVAHPRLGSIASMRRAREIGVRTLTRKDLPGEYAHGFHGSPTRVKKTFVPEEADREGISLSGPEAGVAAILEAFGAAAGRDGK